MKRHMQLIGSRSNRQGMVIGEHKSFPGDLWGLGSATGRLWRGFEISPAPSLSEHPTPTANRPLNMPALRSRYQTLIVAGQLRPRHRSYKQSRRDRSIA